MTKEEIINLLANHRTIGHAPRKELAWIASHATLRQLAMGDMVARRTEIVDGLHFLISGHISIYVDRGAGRRKVMEWRGGDVTGILPYSRMVSPPGDTTVDEPTEAVTLHRSDLPGLIRNCQEVTATLVHVMTDRARRFTSSDLRDEKLISLGKLASGLAHELNNPASAAVSDAKSLAAALTTTEDAARTLGAAGLSRTQLAELDAVRDLCLSSAAHETLSGLALGDREEAIASWLRAHGVTEGIAGELARTSIADEALDRLAGILPGAALEPGLQWIAGGCAARTLVVGIERAVMRIHGLVAAVKGFTHMDRAPAQEPVDITRGITDTVAILRGKAGAHSVVISLDLAPDLPPIRGINAEINQVWMNLIDNAIDATPPRGQVTVHATHAAGNVIVTVTDDGPGIPPDIRESIFEPFFTTKSVGKGTGLGLDIVRRIVDWHEGDIDVASQPGHTEFRVRFPLAGKEPGEKT